MWKKQLNWMVMLVIMMTIYEIGWKIRQKYKQYPPGPSNIVIMYYVIKTCIVKGGYDPIYVGKHLLKHYGSDGIIYHGFPLIYWLKLCIIFNSKLAKQILNNKNALDRPIIGNNKPELHIENTADGTAPFANINGKEWERRRKLSQSILFRFCNQSKFLNKVLEEELINVIFPKINIYSKNNKLWYPSKLIKHCVFNTIFYANYGRHISMDDPIYDGMIEVITETFQLFESGIVYGVMPEILLFFVKLNPFSDYYKILKLIKKRDALGKTITNRTNKMLKKRRKDTENNDNKKQDAMYYVDYLENELTESQVEADMAALFGAGTDTTSSSINFAIVLAAKYENIQDLIRNELIECYQENMSDIEQNEYKRFEINWITQLQYFRAFIYEVLRVSSITKGGLPHCAKQDIYIDIDNDDDDKGKKRYCIPKGTVIGYEIEAMHKYTDKENWIDSSDEMCLENWLNKETARFEINESFLTFGSGRRDCVGKSFAIKEMYIIMAMLLLNYKISFQNNKNDINKPIQTLFNGVNIIHPPIGVIVKRLY